MSKRIRRLKLDLTRPVESSVDWSHPALVYLRDPRDPERTVILDLTAEDVTYLAQALTVAAGEIHRAARD